MLDCDEVSREYVLENFYSNFILPIKFHNKIFKIICLNFHLSSNSVSLHFANVLVHAIWKSEKIIKNKTEDFPSGPVVKTLCFHCKGSVFDPW